jgi:hypothetical protein
MHLLLSRVRHVTFSQAAQASHAQFALPTTFTASGLIFTQESWVMNSLSVSIWFDALAAISINPIRRQCQALS